MDKKNGTSGRKKTDHRQRKRAVVFVIISIILGLNLTACAQGAGATAEGNPIETTVSPDSSTDSLQSDDGVRDESGLSENQEETEERKTLDDWLGIYSYSEHYGIETSPAVDVLIYQEDGEYYAYVESNGFSYTLIRLTARVEMEGEQVSLYFLESSFPTYFQEGQLLFSLRDSEDGVRVKWGMIDPDSNSTEEGRMDSIIRFSPYNHVMNDHHYILMSEKEAFFECRRGNIDPQYWAELKEVNRPLLEAYQTGREERIHFFDYNEDGNVILEFYYDPVLCRGAGVYGLQVSSNDSEENFAFSFQGYKIKKWKDDQFSIPGREKAKQSTEITEYEESWEYNQDGRPTYFRAEGTVELDDEKERRGLLNGEFKYRQDGTLQEKEYVSGRPLGYRYGSCFYDEKERLTHRKEDVNHGISIYYYIYEGDSMTPSWRLMVDPGWGADFVKYVE